MLSLVKPWTTTVETAESVAHVSIKSEVEESDDGFGVDELDLIPLKDRLKMLVRSSKIGSSGGGDGVAEGGCNGVVKYVVMPIDVVVKKEEGDCSSSQNVALDQAGLHFIGEGKGVEPCKQQDCMDCIGERNAAGFATSTNKVDFGTIQPQETHANDLSCSQLVTHPKDKGDFVGLIKVEADIHDLPERLIHSSFSVKVERSDYNTVIPNKDDTFGCVQKVDEGCGVKNETDGEVGTDELDHIPLVERRRTLVSRISVETTDQISSSAQSTILMAGVACNSVVIKEESQYVAENGSQSLASDSSFSSIAGASSVLPCFPNASNFGEVLSPKPCSSGGFHKNKKGCLPEITKFESEIGNAFMSVNCNNMLASDLPTFPAKIKAENLKDSSNSPSDSATGVLSYYNKILLKSEVGVYNDPSDGDVDHLTLLQRMKLLIPTKSLLCDTKDLKCSRKNTHSALDSRPATSEVHTTRGISYRRKRKKTATDSVEMALEEDAPGLLKVLMDKGIMIDEMKLYGDSDNADPLDVALDEDSFQDLEIVISKLFNTGSSMLKFAPERCTKGSKRSYCLGCLISLVEQTRYLRFRKWPVEWGWCRDLQSFIFVFERHNRIVLERPEYGYATYFFELVDSLTVDWQVKRLVTAMKLTSCGRATLIENKSLLVGEDLTVAEARVLEEYGWTPNSGLGSMLNYCDRVIHDRNKESDVSEWRSKIGKLLMDGINGGIIVLANLPKKVIGHNSTQTPEIKLEL